MRNKKSILFINPDYHCSFFYRDQFRLLGWRADIFVQPTYPNELLFSDSDIKRPFKVHGKSIFLERCLGHVLKRMWYLANFWRYKFHLYYGPPPAFSFLERNLGLTILFGKDFLIELWLANLFGIKLIFMPTGCNEDESKANFGLLDGGNVCANCGAFDRCNDERNLLNFSRIRRYFDLNIAGGSIHSSQYKSTHIKYKAIDLEQWSPSIAIPIENQLPESASIKVLHSSFLKNSGRTWNGRNVKGSPYVLSAIKRLREEGHPVEYYYIENVPSNKMRFYQSQADIIVEQLIYGWWGSTGVEAMALGKPVVCYLRPSWKDSFFKTFPEYDGLPIVEADTKTIYEVLKSLVVDADLRRQKGDESRRFAETHFDPQKNTRSFAAILEDL